MGFGTGGQRKRESLGPGFRLASAVVRLWHTFTFEKSVTRGYGQPDDRRPPKGNRWTRPASRSLPTFQASLQGRRRLLTGDLYITKSPPELLSAKAQDQARRRRPPSPRRQCLAERLLGWSRGLVVGRPSPFGQMCEICNGKRPDKTSLMLHKLTHLTSNESSGPKIKIITASEVQGMKKFIKFVITYPHIKKQLMSSSSHTSECGRGLGRPCGTSCTRSWR